MQTATLASTSALRFRKPRTPSEHDAERQLVAGLVADDPAAWRRFNQDYSAVLHRAIGRVLGPFGSVSSSDDVREVYAKLCLSLISRDKIKLRSFAPERGAKLGSWLVRMAIQASYDHLRRIRRSPVDGRFELFDVPTDEGDPYTECWERERAAILARALGQLSQREREFWELYYGAGLDPQEIARRMNISVATVYTKKHKLERRLEELLAEQRLAA